MKTVISVLLLHYLFALLTETCELFIICFNTRCQLVTPLLNYTCTMAWSGVTHSGDSCECCVYSPAIVSFAT